MPNSGALFPDEWDDSEDVLIRANVSRAMQKHTEIVLPETFDQLVRAAEETQRDRVRRTRDNTRFKKRLTYQQYTAWKEADDKAWQAGISAWDDDIATLPLIKGNVVIRSKDKKIVCIKLNGGTDLPWGKQHQRQGRMTSKQLVLSRYLSIGN